MQSCTARWDGPRSSWRKNREWTSRPRRKSPLRSLLIYHPCSGRRRELELAGCDRTIDDELLQDDRAGLTAGLDDLDTPDQAVLSRHPHSRRRIGKVRGARLQRDYVDGSTR